MIQFEKVSFDQFAAGAAPLWYRVEDLRKIYDNIKLPIRATSGSAGYDIVSPFHFRLRPGETFQCPLGIRVKMPVNMVLLLLPRSGLGFKFRMQLDNTVGVIDSDYYDANNEGHISLKVTNDTNTGKTLEINEGDKIIQGIFLRYELTDDDAVTEKRKGGFGSTGR